MNMAIRRLLLSTALVSVFAGLPAYARAQSSSPADPATGTTNTPAATTNTPAPTTDQTAAPASGQDNFGDIIVQARRTDERLTDVPVAVTALSSNTLRDRNITAVTDIQLAVPNLQIKPSTINPTQLEFIIRGQRQTLFTDENVVTYVNGIPQSTRGVTLYDLQSVQALKGPQGTLFGKNSEGGAMVFTTAQPEYSRFGVDAQIEYGNYNLMRAEAAVNIPIASSVALRVAGQVERRDGVYRNIYPGMTDPGDRNNSSIRGSLKFETGALTNTLVVDYLERDENTPPAIIEAAYNDGRGFNAITRQAVINQSLYGGSTAVVEGDLIVRRGSPFNVNMLTGFNTTIPGTDFINTNASSIRNYGLANTTDFKVSPVVTLKNIFGLRYDRAIDQSDGGGLLGQTYNLAVLNPQLVAPGQFNDNNSSFLTRTKQLTEEFQLIVTGNRLNLIAGGFYGYSDYLYAGNSFLGVSQDFGAAGIFPVSFYPSTARHGQTTTIGNSYAVFAQGTYDFGGIGLDGLRLTLGGRQTWDKREFTGSNFFSPSNAQLQDYAPGYTCNLLNGAEGGLTSVADGTRCQVAGDRTYKAFTYTASLEYKFNPDMLLYAATRRGFKSGGPTPTTRNLSYLFFGGERLTDYEVGFKTSSRLGNVPFRFNVAAFLGNYRDIQTQDFLTFCNNPTQPAASCAVASGTYTDLIVVNIGRATIKGIELDAGIKPFPDLTIDLGYSYQETKYGAGSVIPQPTIRSLPISNDNAINLAGGVDVSGMPFAGVAKHTLNASANYKMSFVPESFAKVMVSGNYSFRGPTTGSSPQGIYKTPSFGVFGGRVAFNNLFQTPMSLSIWAQNLANAKYRLYCADNADSLGYVACRWGEPRTYGATLAFHF